MKQLTPHLLWLGHAGEGRDIRRIFDEGIKALVELALEEQSSQPPRELIYCRFPLLDGPGNDATVLCLAIRSMETLLKARVPILLCCANGMSRSPAIAAAALALIHGESPEAWLQRIAEHHPSDVSPALWYEVKKCLAGFR